MRRRTQMEEKAIPAGTLQEGREMRGFWLMGGALLLSLLLAVLLAARPADASTRIKVQCNVYPPGGAMVDPIYPALDHLHHLFGGKPLTDQSTGGDLKSQGTTSCSDSWFTSAGWFPVARNGNQVVPLASKNQVIVYYRAPGDPTKVQPIPTNLGLVTHDFKIKSGGNVTLTFPDCITQADAAPRPNDRPVEAKAVASHQGNCPSDHPYRIPRVSFQIRYAGPITSQTEVSGALDEWMPFNTEMHADYLAANQDIFNNKLIDQCLRHGTAATDPACE
jgi:hypothetical protein